MKVIFLDFDGVLNRETDEAPAVDELWTEAWLDAVLVRRLANMVTRTGAHVVVSSSWRLRRSATELERILARAGCACRIVDVTPRLARGECAESEVRGREIARWLEEHPEVSAYVALDDEPSLGPVAERHVRTDPEVGLSGEDVERACAILALELDVS